MTVVKITKAKIRYQDLPGRVDLGEHKRPYPASVGATGLPSSGHLRTRIVWVRQAHRGPARCCRLALLERAIGAIGVATTTPVVILDANRIITGKRLGLRWRGHRQNRDRRQQRQSWNAHPKSPRLSNVRHQHIEADKARSFRSSHIRAPWPISAASSARWARLACQCCAICSRVGTQTRSWLMT